MATFNELKDADPGQLPPAKLAEVYYQGTLAVWRFVGEKIFPMIRAVISPSEREKAFIGTFYRMGVWFDALVRLGSEAAAFQAVSAATRGLFELLMDLKLLESDQTPASVDRFHAYTEVDRFWVARTFVEFKDKNPGAKLFSDKAQRATVTKAGEQARIEGLVVQHWGTTGKGKIVYPDHWSNMTARERADKLGDYFAEMYRYLYPMASWNMHPSLTGQGGMGIDTFLRYVALFNNFSQDFFLDGLDILTKELKLNVAIKDLRNQLDELGLQSGAPLIKALMDKIDAEAAVVATQTQRGPAAAPARARPAMPPPPAAPAPPAITP